MGCGRLPRFAKILIPIIDSAMVNQSSVLGEHRGLWCDRYLAFAHQYGFRITNGSQVISKFIQVILDLLLRFRLDGIYKKNNGARLVPGA